MVEQSHKNIKQKKELGQIYLFFFLKMMGFVKIGGKIYPDNIRVIFFLKYQGSIFLIRILWRGSGTIFIV